MPIGGAARYTQYEQRKSVFCERLGVTPVICHELRGGPSRRFIACGSMVLADSIFFVFALAERKDEKNKNIKYRSAEGKNADCVSPGI